MAAVLAVSGAGASADIIFDNFGPGDSFSATGRILEGESAGLIGDVDQAAAFTLGTDSYLLTSITLGLGVNSSPVDGRGPVRIQVVADSGGSPGLLLQEVEIDVNLTGDHAWTGAFPGTLLLEANTTYWIVADAREDFDGAWRFNDTDDDGITAGRSGGGVWNVRPVNDQYAFRVEGRLVDVPVIPEPGAGIAVAAVLAGLGAHTWRRNRARGAEGASLE